MSRVTGRCFLFWSCVFGIRNYNEWKILIIACKMTWFYSDFYLMDCFLFDVGMLLLMVCHLLD
ncbi:hypothetical protein [Staphylococcus aureus]|uniref:hypothetical protein n=1 Tax=Staphylococcus aureus TaxID=1280 RepID=UPI00085CC01A